MDNEQIKRAKNLVNETKVKIDELARSFGVDVDELVKLLADDKTAQSTIEEENNGGDEI